MDQPAARPLQATPARWVPGRHVATAAPLPSFWTMLGRGAVNRCPVCGEGRVFQGYLTVVPECSVCHAPLGSLRADDAPPYFTIFLVGHLLVPVVFWVERNWEPPMWVHMAVWLPLFAIASTLLLRPVKGATVGLMLRLGFGGSAPAPASSPDDSRRDV
ncbi:DUF983 domain-containing protein [Roseomonas sp. OT10]|uniref:DUF983 domain-containing protein n=1 Tax=Roseomonas cutis TaxID=2897332 RepID=UPI001E3FA411|nr:DUF983 domain-containing protein [Roseomonas sp. OT10]UFN49807.1 DUF983 domain-containing protein [Roseomonas sp. OT10]